MSREEQPVQRASHSHEEEGLSLLVEALSPGAPDPATRAQLVAALRGRERFTPWASELARVFNLERHEAEEALQRIDTAEAWQPGFWPGSRLLATPSLKRESCVIARLPGGVCIPRHKHQARELTYILAGELLEDCARHHKSGALLDMAAGSEHQLTVPDGEECLVVFSVRLA